MNQSQAMGQDAMTSAVPPWLEHVSDQAMRQRISQTLDKLGPATVRASVLVKLLDANPSDVHEVTQAILHCPTLTARVLSVINSAAYGLPREVTAIQRAVALLGPARARGMAMAYGMRTITERAGIPRLLADTLWASCLAKAAAARLMCELLDPKQAENAYCLALIQDIGLPMLLAVDVTHYQQELIPQAAQHDWSQRERAHFGLDHATVGQGLLREWHGDTLMQQAVLHHHRTPPEPNGPHETPLQLSLFMASLMPHLDEEPSPRQMAWIQAMHAQFLSHAFSSPESFFGRVNESTRDLRAADSLSVINQDVLIKRLINEVAGHAVGVTSKLCRIEHRLRQDRRDVSELKFQAFTDPLTKVLNRRGFAQLSQRRLDMAVEQGLGVCCMLSDMDEFKAVNDNFGHEVGDQVLRGLAKMMRRSLGANDLIGRLGGDEFAIFIVGVDEQQAYLAAQKLVDTIEGVKLRVRPDLEVPVFFSLGAVYCRHELDKLTIDDLLTLADQAMYQRKRQSKHGLVFAVHPPDQADLAENPHGKTRRSRRPSAIDTLDDAAHSGFMD